MPPPTPALPDYRLHCMIPFQTIGIDYAGPIFVKDVYSRCGELFKCYFMLITCTASRAVDIELTSAFSSNLLILALRRCFLFVEDQQVKLLVIISRRLKP